MKVLITGGTGFIGSALCLRLQHDKHELIVLSRHPELLDPALNGISTLAQLTLDDKIDSVINLAGEPIANKRWTEKQKQRITNSRLDVTQQLITYFKMAKYKPSVFITGSAIGYYGIGVSNEILDETASGDMSFSSQLCQQWEALALQAESFGSRTCIIRTGVVLGNNGGVLNKMLTPFKMGLGGKMGSGSQWMSWIHLEDLLGIIIYCLNHSTISGAINGTAPKPVTNLEFTKTLGKVLKRPTFLPLPASVVKLLMGKMGEELILAGKKIKPVKIQKSGYTFSFDELEDALTAVVRNNC